MFEPPDAMEDDPRLDWLTRWKRRALRAEQVRDELANELVYWVHGNWDNQTEQDVRRQEGVRLLRDTMGWDAP